MCGESQHWSNCMANDTTDIIMYSLQCRSVVCWTTPYVAYIVASRSGVIRLEGMACRLGLEFTTLSRILHYTCSVKSDIHMGDCISCLGDQHLLVFCIISRQNCRFVLRSTLLQILRFMSKHNLVNILKVVEIQKVWLTSLIFNVKYNLG